jgi:hypothetical protein
MSAVLTMKDFRRDPSGVDAALARGGTLRATPRELVRFSRGIRSITFSPAAYATVRSIGGALAAGGSATIDRAVLAEVGATIEPVDPGDVEVHASIGLGVAAAVIAVALVAGFGLGYALSDAADSDGSTVEVKNEGGTVKVNVGGGDGRGGGAGGGNQ